MLGPGSEGVRSLEVTEPELSEVRALRVRALGRFEIRESSTWGFGGCGGVQSQGCEGLGRLGFWDLGSRGVWELGVWCLR